jgi:hypothetical protein
MPDKEFERNKKALAANKLTKDRALGDESLRHWDHVFNQRWVGAEVGPRVGRVRVQPGV